MSDNCEEIRALIGAYAIGATDEEETRLVEASLEGCPEVAQELADYARLSIALHDAVPMRYDAPPAAQILAKLNPAQATPEAAPAKRAAPQEARTTAQAVPRPTRRNWWLAVAAVFAVGLVGVVSNLFWVNRVNELEQAQADLQAQINTRPTPSQPFAVNLSPDEVHHRVLTATTAGLPGAEARVIWNSEIEVGSLFVTGLEPLPPNMAYQLWVVRDDETLSLGQFTVDDSGVGILIFQSPEPIASFEAMGISPEPASGSDHPTHEHVVVGSI